MMKILFQLTVILTLSTTMVWSQVKPNIIFILTDDLGYGDLGVLYQNAKSGSKKLSTPELDKMATSGTTLNRHYCPAPVCAPSRASLLSGLHQGHANVRNNQFDKAIEKNHNLASTLKTAGYYTAIIGKYGLQGKGKSPATWQAYPTKRGFDYFYGYVTHIAGHHHYPGNSWSVGGSKQLRSPQKLYENNAEVSSQLDKCYTTDLFTARAKQVIIDQTQNAPAQPFFLYLAYDTPHAALQLPTVAYPSGKGVRGGLQWLGTRGKMINTAKGVIDSYYNPLYAEKSWPDADKRFATMVTRIDHCIGDLLQTLKDLKIENNTIVIFSSDNGPHSESYIPGVRYAPTAFQSYGPFEGMKRDGFEGGIRVPTLAWGPGHVKANNVSNHPSQFHDWLTTFCDFAGIAAPARGDGVSLVPALTGNGTQKAGTVYVEYDVRGQTPSYKDFSNHRGAKRKQMQVVYLDGYKGIRTNTTSHSVPFEIYDTIKDLKESNNLASSSPDFVSLEQRMRDQVLRIRRPNPTAPRSYDNELVPAISAEAAKAAPGIKVSAYEGEWTWIPKFENLKAVSMKQVANISTNHLGKSTAAGLLYTGYLSIPTDGAWTFYNRSDAGTVLRIHDSLVIDDDYGHTGSEVSGTIRLKAGLHPFRLYYRSADAAPELEFHWSGPGVQKAIVPDGHLFHDKAP